LACANDTALKSKKEITGVKHKADDYVGGLTRLPFNPFTADPVKILHFAILV